MVFIVTLIFVPVTAFPGVSAPVVYLPETGQTTSYYAGDDGDFEMGVTWPGPRFTNNGNGTITDNLTGLIWLRDANCLSTSGNDFDGQCSVTTTTVCTVDADCPGGETCNRIQEGSLSWYDAMLFVEDINSDSVPNIANCGYTGGTFTDWRMPNINELDSLFNFGTDGLAGWLASQGFQNVQSANYWVSTSYSKFMNHGWAARITTNGIHLLYEDLGQWSGNRSNPGNPVTRPGFLNDVFPHIWPVRGGPDNTPDPTWPANLSKTGQKSSRGGAYSRDDGGLEYGISWPTSGASPSGRFNCGTDTCTDLLTGLMWLKNAGLIYNLGGGYITWTDALEVVAEMNTGNQKRCITDPSNRPACNEWTSDSILDTPCPLSTYICEGGWNVWGECRGPFDTPCTSDSNCNVAYEVCSTVIPNYGYTDWRLPNIWELKSVLNFEFECVGMFSLNPAGDCPWETGNNWGGNKTYLNWEGFTGFPNGRHGYWSSTTNAYETTKAYTLGFGRQGGTMGSNNKTYTVPSQPWGPDPEGWFLWPVRTAGGDDGDGVPVETEDNAPNNGDGNGDGTQDFLQSRVASIPAATDQSYITVITPQGADNCVLENVQTMTEPGPPNDDPANNYPYGLVSFEIPCSGPVQVTVLFHGTIDLSAFSYRKNGPNPPAGTVMWYDMPGAVFDTTQVGGQTVARARFTLTDGAIGDDTIADGTIYDDGGPGELAPSTAIPTMTEWGMIIFMMLAVLAGVYYIRRKRKV